MNNLLIISPYPEAEKYSHQTSALASFTANLVEALLKTKKNLKILVFADKSNYNQDKSQEALLSYYSNQSRIIHFWQKNDPLIFFQLFKKIKEFKDYQNILIQYEWNVFGKGSFYLTLFPFFLCLLRLIGKKSYIVTHAVNFDFKAIFGKGVKTYFLNLFSCFFYFLIGLLSNKIIVTEQEFKNRLTKLFLPSQKIVFIPHGVDVYLPILNQIQSKKLLKISLKSFLLVNFGFLNPYKGTDILVKLFNSLEKKKDDMLYFVGGESLNLKDALWYKNFLKNLYSEVAKKKQRVKITGFIPEGQIPFYLSACDLMIFPHKIFLSSSGPLSLAFSFEKPFILSRPLAGYFESEDFQQALKETGLKKEDFIFDFTPESFEKRLDWAKNNLEKLSLFSKLMKHKRSWEKVAGRYLKVLTT